MFCLVPSFRNFIVWHLRPWQLQPSWRSFGFVNQELPVKITSPTVWSQPPQVFTPWPNVNLLNFVIKISKEIRILFFLPLNRPWYIFVLIWLISFVYNAAFLSGKLQSTSGLIFCTIPWLSEAGLCALLIVCEYSPGSPSHDYTLAHNPASLSHDVVHKISLEVDGSSKMVLLLSTQILPQIIESYGNFVFKWKWLTIPWRSWLTAPGTTRMFPTVFDRCGFFYFPFQFYDWRRSKQGQWLNITAQWRDHLNWSRW